MRSFSQFAFYTIMCLALVGLISLIINDPVGLLTQLLFVGVIVAVVIFLVKRFSNRGSSAAGYRQAVKQSKQRYRERFTRPNHLKVIRSKPSKRRQALNRLKRRDDHQLTVIDGKKKRKRKRVFF